MVRWHARSVLGVPMVLRGDVAGILCLDTEDTTAEFSQLDQDLAVSFAELAATAINQVQLTAQLRASLQTQARQLEMLQRARRMEGQLADVLLRGWGVRELAEAMTKLLSKPCAIYDAELRCLTRLSGPHEGERAMLVGAVAHYPAADEVMRAMEPGRIHYLDSAPQAGFPDRLLAVPIDLNGERYGYIVVSEVGGRFGTLEEVIVRRAAHNIGLERLRSKLDGEMEWHAIESFTASLIRGEHDDLDALAKSLGIDMKERHVVCLVASRDASSRVRVTPQQVAQLLTVRESPSAALAARIGSEIAVILSVPHGLDPHQEVAWARERLQVVLDTLSMDGELCASISAPESDVAQDPRAHREAQQTLRCIREHVSDALPGVLTVDDLGAARMMLASTSREDARQLAKDALGPLLADPSLKSEELLSTFDSFLRCSRGVRDCADELGVHPNTVRYRLASVERLTRLAVTTDDDDYMTAQMAMAIIRLNGQLPGRTRDDAKAT
jgi:sugar diacid utilization regulator